MTFNSFKIFRHMSRLFYVAGDPELAKRTLRLYVQIVSKAREASMAEAETATAESTGAFGAGKDIDTDAHWVQTLVHGSRMLSRLALAQTDMSKAVDEAKEAGEMLEKAKTRLDVSDKALLATVQLAEAVWHIAMAYTGKPIMKCRRHRPDTVPQGRTCLPARSALRILLPSCTRPSRHIQYRPHIIISHWRISDREPRRTSRLPSSMPARLLKATPRKSGIGTYWASY